MGDPITIGLGAVLTVTAAARALQLRDEDARTWLEERGLIHRVAGRERVTWRRVLDAIEQGDAPRQAVTDDIPRRRGGSLPRARI